MEIKKLAKKSQGHIEVILSFALFIGAVLFIFLFINPSLKNDNKTNIEQITDKIINEMSLKIGKLSIISTSTSDCYDYTDNYGVSFVETKKDKEFIIYFSDENVFNNIQGKRDNNCADYDIGVFSEENIIVYSKIADLKDRYDIDYEGLKKDLKISDDFLFEIKNIDGQPISELSAKGNIPSNTNVNAREFPIRVINGKGEIQELLFNIRVW